MEVDKLLIGSSFPYKSLLLFIRSLDMATKRTAKGRNYNFTECEIETIAREVERSRDVFVWRAQQRVTPTK